MNKFNDSAENDSFDDILATMDVPTAGKTSSTQAKHVSPAKKPRLSFDHDDTIADNLLANVVMPEATASSHPAAMPMPISAGKTNCVLVNPKQRGNSRFLSFIYSTHHWKSFPFRRQSNSQGNRKRSMGIWRLNYSRLCGGQNGWHFIPFAAISFTQSGLHPQSAQIIRETIRTACTFSASRYQSKLNILFIEMAMVFFPEDGFFFLSGSK